MAENLATAETMWPEAQKLRKKLLGEVSDLQKAQVPGDLEQYQKLEGSLAQFRLPCVAILKCEPEFFIAKVQEPLWKTHTRVNDEFRRALSKLKGGRQTVLKSKLTKCYLRFLKTSFEFYKFYVGSLGAHFDIPELRLAADKVMPQQPVEQQDKIPPATVSAKLREDLFYSSLTAIICIGDLARWQEQARLKKSKNDGKESDTRGGGKSASGANGSHGIQEHLSAHTYYDLAARLKPGLGHAYHQKSVMYSSDDDIFDAIFWLYRAVTADNPHEIAKANLEGKLKTVRTSDLNAGGNPRDALATFKKWFVRYHALAYHGESFPQQEELEKEMKHRLHLCVVQESDAALTLMKMVLMNMAAYAVTLANVENSATERTQRGAYFMLRLNILFFGTLTHTLLNSLEELRDQRLARDRAHSSGQPADPVDARTLATATQRMCLPLIRLYASWLLAYRNEIRAADQSLEGPLLALCYDFASCLTLLGNLYGDDVKSGAPYLLPEDTLEVGSLVLRRQTMIVACLPSFDPQREATKIWNEDLDESQLRVWHPNQENLARIFDILHCGICLCKNGPLPFAYNQLHEGSLVFTYNSPEAQQDVGLNLEEPSIKSHAVRQPNELGMAQAEAQSFSNPGKAQKTRKASRGARKKNEKDSSAAAYQDKQDTTTALAQDQHISAFRGEVEGRAFQEANGTGHPSHNTGFSDTIHANANHDGSYGAAHQQNDGSALPGSTFRQAPPGLINGSRGDRAPTTSGHDDYNDMKDDTGIMDMIGGLLEPPTLNQPEQPNTPAQPINETPYGSLSGLMKANNAGARSPSRAFPALPWDYYLPGSPVASHATPLQQPESFRGTRTMPQTYNQVHDPVGPSSFDRRADQSVLRNGHHGGASPAREQDQAGHRARLLQAFGQSRADSSSGAQNGMQYQQQTSYASGFPGSNDMSFSHQSSIYQGTPQYGGSFYQNQNHQTPPRVGSSGISPAQQQNVYGRPQGFSPAHTPAHNTMGQQASRSPLASMNEMAQAYQDMVLQSAQKGRYERHADNSPRTG